MASILQNDRPEKQKAESPLVALTLPLAATRPSLSPLGPEPLKDPWLSAPRSRGVWFSQLLRDRPGKGPCLNELVRGLLSWHCMRRCGELAPGPSHLSMDLFSDDYQRWYYYDGE